MKAFWWFKENSIAGMARPGFNTAHWLDLSFDEAAMLGWIGQFSSGAIELESFKQHLQTYVPQIYKYHKLSDESGAKAIQIFDDVSGILSVLERLSRRTRIIEDFRVIGKKLHLEISSEHLEKEIQFLKSKNIHRLISLTEDHHNKDLLKGHFALHHIGIKDLGAPSLEQAHELAELIKAARKDQETIAVHCLAGIGRTSTMLMAAHILLGENFQDMQSLLRKKNPSFALSESQISFVKSLQKA